MKDGCGTVNRRTSWSRERTRMVSEFCVGRFTAFEMTMSSPAIMPILVVFLSYIALGQWPD